MLKRPELPGTTPTSATQKPGAASPPSLPTPPCGCDADPVAALKVLFVDVFQGAALARGRDPATRPVFLRLHGVAHGTLAVRPDLPAELRVGVFGGRPEYPVWVRFSSDVQPGKPDLKGTVGIAIKLFGVAGEKLLEPDRDAGTHDFVLQNHDVFFVDTAKDMCEFTCDTLNGKFDEYVQRHPVTGQILSDMEKVIPTALGATYWSVLPSRFGPKRHVKYKLEPEVVPDDGSTPDLTDPFYLRADLQRRLTAGDSRFRLLVQFQTDEGAMPLDRATVRWDEGASPPVHVATLVLPRQDTAARGQAAYGENLAFNPWHALAEHEPVGSLAAARRVVYQASADVRRNFNGVPLGEPEAPRPAEWYPGTPYPPAKDTTVVRAAIHPAIGVARVGNSPSAYWIGPEVLNPIPETSYRDGAGALKRQAARFRVYGYNAAGQVVRELTADAAAVRWSVHVANRKAEWFQWRLALDVPEAAPLEVPRRNAKATGSARRELTIDPGTRSISGKDTSGSAYELRGKFMGEDVLLGELRTDGEGRLLVLPGLGKAGSPTRSPIFTPEDENTFANADGWYDDIADGPVTAEVSIEGRSVPVDPAWVVTAPPNYAPSLLGVRTLYDVLVDLYVRAGWLPFPSPVSFRDHVYPIFARLSGLQWVNRGYVTQFGRGGPHDFEDPAYVEKLASRSDDPNQDTWAELRRQVLNSFRDPDAADNNRLPWPWLYGDAMRGDPAAETPREHATVSPTQYRILRMWAAGEFVSDWAGGPPGPREIGKVPLPEQPAMLDRAALDFCLADAFHPGCELTWPMRHLTLYSKPFRVRHRPAGESERHYGDKLTPKVALAPTGPLYAQGPGDLTRWMGIPWHADTTGCRSGYASAYDPYVPSFWPARVPNQVLTRDRYDVVRDTSKPREERLAAFSNRFNWFRPIKSLTFAGQMENLVQIFGDMGVLEAVEGVADDPDLPPTMQVASFGPGVPPSTVEAAPAAAPAVTLAAVDAREQLRGRARELLDTDSPEEKARFPRPVRLPE